jgi:serine/threonine-protein kinase
VTAGPAPGPGDTFGGYVIESLLGRGGMGAVYLATHERLRRRVALKLIAPELADDEAFRARFLRESQLAAALDHPNVLPIYDAGDVDGVLYLAMRYVSGASLQALIRGSGWLSPSQTLRLAGQIGGALDAARGAGLVHRDVKPANILIAEPNAHAYLSDFGLAKRASSQGVTIAGSFLGTVDFSSPEQIQGLPLDGRADLYSLGCVLFNCLTGQPPYLRDSEIAVLHAHLHAPPPTVTAVRPELPQALDAVVATAMAKDPADRQPSGATLSTAFAEALQGSVAAGDEATRVAFPLAPTSGSEPRFLPGRQARRSGRRWLIAAVIVAVLAAAAAAAVILATRGSSSPRSAADLGTFVDRIENILVQSSAGRQEINDALTAGLNCSISPDEAGRRIASVGDNRQSILEQLGTLATPTQQASHLVTLLQQGLQDSIEADRHYRDAFAAVGAPGPGCTIPENEDFKLAAKADSRATAAKKHFIAGFDPLAVRYGQRTWSAGEF